VLSNRQNPSVGVLTAAFACYFGAVVCLTFRSPSLVVIGPIVSKLLHVRCVARQIDDDLLDVGDVEAPMEFERCFAGQWCEGNVFLIPGTSSVAHLRENLAAERLILTPRILAELDGIAS